MVVHFCVLTSPLHIGGWEKDCVTEAFRRGRARGVTA
jgi:hypothetical protein